MLQETGFDSWSIDRNIAEMYEIMPHAIYNLSTDPRNLLL